MRNTVIKPGEICLKQGESYTNTTGEAREMQVSYINSMGQRQTHFGTISHGETITKTSSETVVHIL